MKLKFHPCLLAFALTLGATGTSLAQAQPASATPVPGAFKVQVRI